MKILIFTDSRGMWPREYSWPNVLKQLTGNIHEVHEYIGGVHNWLISIHMMEEYLNKNFPNGGLDLIILQAGWHEGGPCFWPKETWQEIIKNRFKEPALIDEILGKDGKKKYLYKDRETEKEILNCFARKSKRVLVLGLHGLRSPNDLDKEYGLGMKHHYDVLEANNEFDIPNVDFFNFPMDDAWINHHCLPDRIHYNYNGVNFISSCIVRYIQKMDYTIRSFLVGHPQNHNLYHLALSFGSEISKISKEADRIILASREPEVLFIQLLGCILYKRVPIVIQRPSIKVFSSEFGAKMEEIKARINPSLCVCDAENQTDFQRFFVTIDSKTFLANENFEAQPILSPKDIAFIQLSSGTTESIKIIEVTHQQLIENCIEYGIRVDLNESSHVVSWLPLYHDMGLITSVFLPVIFGCKVNFLDTFNWAYNPTSLLKAISDNKGTHVWMPNFAFKLTANKIEESQIGELDLSSLKHLVSCSEPTYIEDIEAFSNKFKKIGLKAILSNCYALAENVFAVTQSVEAKEIDFEGQKVVSCGKVISGVSVLIEKNGEDITATGKAGNVMIKTASLFKNRAQSSFYGYYKTGDLGFMIAEELFILGRESDSFVSYGQNIYPNLIEQKLNEIDKIIPGRAACFGILEKDLGTNKINIVAEVEDIPNSNKIELTILNKIKNEFNLSANIYISPRNFIIKTSSGKISRSRTREKLLACQKVLKVVNIFLVSKNKPTISKFYETLYSSGRLDSLEIMELVLTLEKDGFVLNKDKLTPNSFKIELEKIDTVEKLVDNVV